jgi:hypothetical protein
MFTSKDKTFGPALIAAYEIKSKYALYSRIALDPALLAEFRSNALLRDDQHDLEEETTYVQDLIRKGDDGVWFVDYLRAFERELDEPSMYPNVLIEHRNLIINGAKRFSGLSGVMSKYLWLAVYHNTRVSELTPDWLTYYKIENAISKSPRKKFPRFKSCALVRPKTLHANRHQLKKRGRESFVE